MKRRRHYWKSALLIQRRESAPWWNIISRLKIYFKATISPPLHYQARRHANRRLWMCSIASNTSAHHTKKIDQQSVYYFPKGMIVLVSKRNVREDKDTCVSTGKS